MLALAFAALNDCHDVLHELLAQRRVDIAGRKAQFAIQNRAQRGEIIRIVALQLAPSITKTRRQAVATHCPRHQEGEMLIIGHEAGENSQNSAHS